MTTLVRSDGTQFVTQAYREQISMKNKSEFVQEIRLLAEQNGQYVQLFNKEKGLCEVVFSTEPGYLLGESIWHYFNDPDNLIYCEALPGSAQVIIVAVSNGSICIDSQILASSLQAELLPLMTGELRYRIVTSGNVPLRKAEGFGTFRFPKALIESFETLDGPLFPRLPAFKALQLQPLPLTLKKEHLIHRFSTSSIIVLVLVIIIGGVWLLTPNEEESSLRQSILHEMSSPYAAYSYALSTPAPDEALLELGRIVNQLYLLPGWQATKVTFKRYHYHVALRSEGGDMQWLRHWSKSRNYQFRLGPRGTELTFHAHLPVRSAPTVVYSLEGVVAQLVDGLDRLLQYQAVSISTTHQRGEVRETQLAIHLENVSPDLLNLVGRQLRGLPVQLTSVNFDLHAGLMSGTIQLIVWGK